MPAIFKVLASISAWALFVFGLYALLFSQVVYLVGGMPEPASMPIFPALAIGIGSLTLPVGAMKLRRMLE